MTTTKTVSDSREILAFIPYRMGFHPTNSVVIVSLRGERQRMGLVVRQDMPRPGEVWPTIQQICKGLREDGASGLLVIFYEDIPVHARIHDLLETIGAAFSTQNFPVVNAWHVGPRWVTNLTCREENCCPPYDVSELDASDIHQMMASLGAEKPRDVRQDFMAEILAQAKDEEREAVSNALANMGLGHVMDTWRAWRQLLTDGVTDADSAAFIIAASRDRQFRDAMLASLHPDSGELPATLAAASTPVDVLDSQSGLHVLLATVFDERIGIEPDPDLTDRGYRALKFLLSRAPEDMAAPVATLLGFLAWWEGNGAVAIDAFDAALKSDPNYELANYLQESLASGIAPGWARKRRDEDVAAKLQDDSEEETNE